MADAPVTDPRITSWPQHATDTQAAAAIQASPAPTGPNCVAAGTTLVSASHKPRVDVLSGLGRVTAVAPAVAPAATVKSAAPGHGREGQSR